MPAESPSNQPSRAYVDINQIRSEHPVSVERLFEYYGVSMPPMIANSREQRMACPFPHCGKKGPTGQKAISIQQDARGFIYKCFHYGCQHGGNDVSFADLLRDCGGDGKPRGDRFRQVLNDYVAMAGGAKQKVGTSTKVSLNAVDKPGAPDLRVNVPLEESDNERARGLTHLPDKFLTDLAQMPPAAAAYIRRRAHWFSNPDEVRSEWGVGYLPMDSGGDRAGGTMRGKMVFPIRALDGKLLAFCGRDPAYEEKLAQWIALPESKRMETPEPAKWRFPKSFHRGLELWGQERVPIEGSNEKLQEQGGLVIVEGAGDVIRLAKAGIVSVGLMSNQSTREQVGKIANMGREYSQGRVQLMLDLDEEGRKGMWKLLELLSSEVYVRVAWTSRSKGGRFQGRQPEELSNEEIADLLAAGEGSTKKSE